MVYKPLSEGSREELLGWNIFIDLFLSKCVSVTKWINKRVLIWIVPSAPCKYIFIAYLQYSGFALEVNRSSWNAIIPVWTLNFSRQDWNLIFLKIRVLLEVINLEGIKKKFLFSDFGSKPGMELFQCGLIALQIGMTSFHLGQFQIRNTDVCSELLTGSANIFARMWRGYLGIQWKIPPSFYLIAFLHTFLDSDKPHSSILSDLSLGWSIWFLNWLSSNLRSKWGDLPVLSPFPLSDFCLFRESLFLVSLHQYLHFQGDYSRHHYCLLYFLEYFVHQQV